MGKSGIDIELGCKWMVDSASYWLATSSESLVSYHNTAWHFNPEQLNSSPP